MAYVQKNNPFPVTSCGRRRTFMNDNAVKMINKPPEDRTKESPFNKSNEPRKTTKGKGRNFRTVKEGAGMTSKGVRDYRRKNPEETPPKLILGTHGTPEIERREDTKHRAQSSAHIFRNSRGHTR